MLSKSWNVALTVLALVAFEVSSAFASGHGATGACAGGATVGGCRTGSGSCFGNSGQFLRAENGIFGPAWGFGNGYCGWGGSGYGLGYGCCYPGWGYSPLVLGYEFGGVPYFSQFPPVYYGYGDNMPVVKASIRSSWVGSESPQPAMEPATSASPSRPPLRIINPYYVEAK